MTKNILVKIFFIAITGCATSSTLRLEMQPVVDNTVPKGASSSFQSLIVLPPAGSDRGAISELAAVEHLLISKGIRVISSGITARVVSEDSSTGSPNASKFSDLERALVLAEKTNADGILQLAEAFWTNDHRAFVRNGDNLDEIPTGTRVSVSNLVRVKEAVFRIQARLIDVKDGSIKLSIDVSQGTSRVVETPKSIPFSFGLFSDVPHEITTDTKERRALAFAQVMDVFLDKVATVSK